MQVKQVQAQLARVDEVVEAQAKRGGAAAGGGAGSQPGRERERGAQAPGSRAGIKVRPAGAAQAGPQVSRQ